MTAKAKNITNILITFFSCSGILSMCIYGFVSYGKVTTRLDDCEKFQQQTEKRIQCIDDKKADKEMVMDMWDDVKYIRKRLDEHMNEDR